MATKKRSVLEEELMTPANIVRVIKLLEPEPGTKPATKKECCQILGMAYNVIRLSTIIEEYKAKLAREKAHRERLRGTPATTEEIVFVIQEYLGGATVDALTKSTYRSASFIKYILESNDVPIRATNSNYFKPQLIPESAMREEFTIGEIVYSARYDSIARIDGIFKGAYRIWLLAERWQQGAYQPAEELANLEHLKKLGVKL